MIDEAVIGDVYSRFFSPESGVAGGQCEDRREDNNVKSGAGVIWQEFTGRD